MPQPQQRWLAVKDWRLPIAAAVALAYAAIAGGELAYTLFYILAGVVTLSYYWASRIHRDLHCLYDLDKNRMSRDDVVTLTLRLDNEGILAVPWAVATDQSTFRDPDADWTFAATIPMASSRLLKQELPIKRRGRYRLGPVSITAGDPFGIFAIHKVTAGHKVITVYPRATPVRAVGTPLRQPFGNSPTDLKSFADPSNLAEIRPYAVGDNPKHIHWPTSARLQQLHVREFELTATGSVYLVLDLGAAAYSNLDSPFAAQETAIDLAAGLGVDLLRQGLEVGLIAEGLNKGWSLRPARGMTQQHHLVEQLVGVTVDSHIPLNRVLEQKAVSHARVTLLIITASLTPALVQSLRGWMRRGSGVGLFMIDEGGASVGGTPVTVAKPGLPFPAWRVSSATRGATFTFDIRRRGLRHGS